MTATEPEVLSLEEAAIFLGVNTFMIREYLRRWIIPGKLVDKEWQFNKADLLWLHNRRFAN